MSPLSFPACRPLVPRIFRALFLLALLLTLSSNGFSQEAQRPTGELIVFAAASLTEPFTEIGKRLETAHPGLKVVFNFAGSPMLRTQLEQGSQADVFAVADEAQMELARKSEVVRDAPTIFAQNTLVIIVPKDNPKHVKEFRGLAQSGLKLDLAGAKVPVGAYSRRAIEKASVAYGADFAQQVLRNVVSEEDNVKQVVAKVQLGEVDAGMVYASDVTARVKNDVQVIPIPDAYNQIASYPIAVTMQARNPSAAQVFIAFVLSPEGQTILLAHGFR